jgi:hypothetical protein
VAAAVEAKAEGVDEVGRGGLAVGLGNRSEGEHGGQGGHVAGPRREEGHGLWGEEYTRDTEKKEEANETRVHEMYRKREKMGKVSAMRESSGIHLLSEG